MYIDVLDKGENIPYKVENPTSEIVNELIAGFTSGNVAFFQLFGEVGHLTVARGEHNRVMVLYNDNQSASKPDYQWGGVLDPAMVSNEQEIRVDWGTETTPNPISRTVPTEKAREIALYFLKHGSPPKGLTWNGRMDRFQ